MLRFYIPEGTPPIAGVYIQAISAYAPHPNAAKLWMEFLYSDEGQLLWMKGYCHPIRNNDLAQRGVIPAEIAAKLPPAEGYAKLYSPPSISSQLRRRSSPRTGISSSAQTSSNSSK